MSETLERVIEYDRPYCADCFGERCERCRAAKPRRVSHEDAALALAFTQPYGSLTDVNFWWRQIVCRFGVRL